ncbi:hypothetical protein [Bacillus cereus]|uniref:hypothetical protein n=1 Tax=Bacillus cereus TaxID=1396 RepID=UPI000BF800AC|nr:hypothetical protein [Bacillus cereus]PER62119.1 hypothetical protein CN502_28080 [Bacillus cereus]PGL32681.1 hypothetical protein CN913_27135 [Bacillus cereus]
MTAEEKEILRQQAIKDNERRISHLETFLDGLPLDTDVNKTVSLEIGTSIMFIEQEIDKLKSYVIKKEMNVSDEGKINVPDSAAMNQTKEGTFKRILVDANYPWELIKDWTEEDCEAELGAIERANK